MQCKDIDDVAILAFIDSWGGEWCFTFEPDWCERSVFRGMPKGTPYALGMAKMRKLVKRGLVDGCTCGCRGDFELTEKGEAFLQAALTGKG